jgi:hypothetical protein
MTNVPLLSSLNLDRTKVTHGNIRRAITVANDTLLVVVEGAHRRKEKCPCFLFFLGPDKAKWTNRSEEKRISAGPRGGIPRYHVNSEYRIAITGR